MSATRLIIGLGNPGPQYALTRHNAGAWLVEALARHYGQALKHDTQHKGRVAKIHESEDHHSAWLFIPDAYMNVCGLSIRAFMQFYKILPTSLLVAHDELDFPAGVVKFQQGRGHAGHNGLRDILRHLNSQAFYRVRLGIGHPGDRDKVSDYVLSKPSLDDKIMIDRAIDVALGWVSSQWLSRETKQEQNK